MQSPVYHWLKHASRHSSSLYSIQLGLRTERPIKYYTTQLLPRLADVAPNLTRLALIAEANRTRPLNSSAVAARVQSSADFIIPWLMTLRNVVVRLPEHEMRHTCQALGEGSFKNLKLVQFSSMQNSESLDRVCVAVGCRVQGTDGALAGRDAFAVAGSMWEDVKRALCYDAIPGRMGEGVRVTVV